METLTSYRTYLTRQERSILDTAVSRHIECLFETLNNRIVRWQGAHEFTAYNPDSKETDHDHILESLSLVEKHRKNFPSLEKVISMTEVKFMLILHDGDELISGIDVPMLSSIREEAGWEEEKKNLQDKFIQKLQIFVEPEFRSKAVELYTRFITQSPTDKEALFARYIDKTQGNHYGLTHHFPYYGEQLEKERGIHVQKSVESIFTPAIALYQTLIFPYSAAFESIVLADIKKFEDAGFVDQAEYALNLWEQKIRPSAVSA